MEYLLADSTNGVYAHQVALTNLLEQGFLNEALEDTEGEDFPAWEELLLRKEYGGIIHALIEYSPNEEEHYWDILQDLENKMPHIPYEGVDYVYFQSENGDVWLWPADRMDEW